MQDAIALDERLKGVIASYKAREELLRRDRECLSEIQKLAGGLTDRVKNDVMDYIEDLDTLLAAEYHARAESRIELESSVLEHRWQEFDRTATDCMAGNKSDESVADHVVRDDAPSSPPEPPLDLAMRIASMKAGDFLEPPQALARQRAWVILAEALKPKE